MWRPLLIHNIRGMVSFRGRCRNKNTNPARTGVEMWCSLIRLAKRWSPHIGRSWGFLQGLLYQRWKLLQYINLNLWERLGILLYLQITKATYLWFALLWHRLNEENLGDADRKSTYNTPYGGEKCDDDSLSIVFGKCQPSAYRIIDVVRSSQAGYTVVTTHWQMVRFPSMSALSEVKIVARNQLTYVRKNADPTLYTTSKRYLVVFFAIVAQTECCKQVILQNERIHKSSHWHMYYNVW